MVTPVWWMVPGWLQTCSSEAVHRPRMEPCRTLVVLLASVLIYCGLGVPRARAAASPAGFLYIDCGSSAPYDDAVTGIRWVPDDTYTTVGSNYVNISNAAIDHPAYPELQSFRYFNDSSAAKNCYSLPVTQNNTYILRASFYMGQVDKLKSTSFQLAIDATIVSNINIQIGSNDYKEFTVVAQTSVMHLCLMRDSTNSIPFISAISLRFGKAPISLEDFLFRNQYVQILYRLDLGGDLSGIKRYPDDSYDRYWHGQNESSSYVSGPSLYKLSSTSLIYGCVPEYAPSSVMDSALGAQGNMTVTLPISNKMTTAYMILYWAELDTRANQTNRQMWIQRPVSYDKTLYENTYNKTGGLYIFDSWEFKSILNKTSSLKTILYPDRLSILQPTLNALELYEIMDPWSVAQTNIQDALAIEAIKTSMALGEWTGDPCVPVSHPWLNCTFSTTSQPQIIAVNLSGYQLNGSSISQSFAKLVSLTSLDLKNCGLIGILPDLSTLHNLQRLDLDNNMLTSQLPEWLTSLTKLTQLFVENNNFSGPIPSQLLSTSTLDFRYGGNPFLGKATSNPKSTSLNLGMIIGVIVGTITMILLVVYFCCFHGRPNENASNRKNISTKGSKPYTLEEIIIATENFKREIGKGGFGSVYYGKLADGQEVAVKVLDAKSHQGSTEFYNEVEILSRVHHKYLVELVGYCTDKENQILIYEFLHQGSLRDHLNHPSSQMLDWTTRLNIAICGAQGLDYLHTGCNPNMIHRDVKSSNILLTNRLEYAKVSDFGLSRLAPIEDETHVVTDVKGTLGYLDPEYYCTQQLSTKSDVFSFGVILLELITSRPVNARTQDSIPIYICEWVRLSLQSGDIETILDPFVRDTNVNRDSIMKIVKVAMKCVDAKVAYRPTMSEVVDEIRQAMILEGILPPRLDVTPATSTKFGILDSYVSSTCDSYQVHIATE